MKKGFVIKTMLKGGTQLDYVARFKHKGQSTECSIYQEIHASSTEILVQLITSAKVTCHEEDTFSIAAGRKEAFIRAMDKYSSHMLKEIEKEYEAAGRHLHKMEDIILTKFNSFMREQAKRDAAKKEKK